MFNVLPQPCYVIHRWDKIRKALHDSNFEIRWLFLKVADVGFKRLRRYADIKFRMTYVNLIVHTNESNK